MYFVSIGLETAVLEVRTIFFLRNPGGAVLMLFEDKSWLKLDEVTQPQPQHGVSIFNNF